MLPEKATFVLYLQNNHINARYGKQNTGNVQWNLAMADNCKCQIACMFTVSVYKRDLSSTDMFSQSKGYTLYTGLSTMCTFHCNNLYKNADKVSVHWGLHQSYSGYGWVSNHA